MNLQPHVYVGTAGHSAWFSEDGGLNWVHPNSHSGMYLEARVWSFASHPEHPDWLLAGTDMGLFQWHEASARWTAIASPLQDVWVAAIHPQDPQLWFVGSRPAGICRSRDGGKTWQTLNVPGLQQFSTINMGATRVTQILFDPLDVHTLWLSVEIGGIFVSHDDGDTWHARDQGLISADVHGIAILDQPNHQRLMYATTNQGLHRSTDGGLHWEFQTIDSPWQYTRAIVPRLDHTGVVFLTNGNGPPGNRGRLLISEDHGAHWQEVHLPGTVNSTVWTVATHPLQPLHLWACTNLGQVFASQDGGWHWERLPQEFGEIRALHWRPLRPGIRQQDHSLTRRVEPV
ncbi:WD40/YVTN/BNR-like repeat-containing protein [Limnohabitans sp.]|uniref:WD40/YVTN/BNR-like repeat-containing protein n=1 Tax=Limnohabitans sp. TaxID=1907725 RepID=UPI0038B9457E